MADNVAITAGAGTTIAADDIGAGVLAQRVKPVWGVDGTGNDINLTTPLPVLAAFDTSQIQNAGTSVAPSFATIITSALGNTEIVASVTGKRIRVIAWDAKVNAAVNIQWFSSTNTGITGLYYNAGQGDGVARAFNPVGYFQTSVGSGLNLNLSASTAVGGCITYIAV